MEMGSGNQMIEVAQIPAAALGSGKIFGVI
jgi:hypothetical protein